MEMQMSQRFRAVISPASSAFWWPRFRLSFTPSKSGFSLCRSEISSHVRSLLPSFTSSTLLSAEMSPFSIRLPILITSRRDVSGSTSSSL